MKNLFLILLFCGHFAFSQTTNPTPITVLGHLESSVQNNPVSPSAIFTVGQYYFFNGKFAEANLQLAKAIDLNKEHASFYLFQAASYEAQGMGEEALNSYDKAVTTETSAEYLLQRAYLRYKLKKYVGAAKDFRYVLSRYETMTDVKKLLIDCEQNGGTADKELETNATTIKLSIAQPVIFIDNFVKQFERFGDAGELYRAMSFLFTNNLDKAIAKFEPLIAKNQNAKCMFLNGIAYELKNNNTAAINSYINATKKTNDEIATALFEKFAGFPNADFNLIQARNSKLDYQFAEKNITAKMGYTPLLPKENDKNIKGSLRTSKTSYNFVIERQKANNYQLVVRDTANNKVMFSNVKTERKGKTIIVKIIWGEKTDASGMSWAVRPQDIFIAHYAPYVNANYSQEGQRTQAAKNTSIDWEALSTIHPENITMKEALSYATRAFMIGYLIK
jgi:tetratricopeptide (TPR) repeat protein